MEYEWIDTWLGAPRFQRYVEQCEGNRGQALKLYEWNSLAGQMLMRDISHFEIALRNGYDKEISSSWEGEHHWLLDPHSPAITPVWRVREKKVKSDGVVFLPFVETSSVMASGTSTGLVL